MADIPGYRILALPPAFLRQEVDELLIGSWVGFSCGDEEAAAVAPDVVVDEVTSPYGEDETASIVDVLGGDVVEIDGSGFDDTLTVKVMSGVSPDYVEEGTCYVFDARYDITATKIYAGVPPLPAGTYHIQVEVGATTVVLEDALKYQPFAEQLKAERVRTGLMRAWQTGDRFLSR
jgi:hypothetical protein